MIGLTDAPAAQATHDHSRGYQLRAFVGLPGVWVRVHGDWQRPIHVWLYRGAWRVLCWPCLTPLRTGDELHDGGYGSQSEAFDAAVAHCRGCSGVAR